MKLLQPLKYLTIKHEEKRWYDIWYPLAASLIVVLVYWFIDKPFSILGKNGLIPQINGLLQILIGFYIASLAAIATFSNKNIDSVMAGTPPTVKEKVNGKYRAIPLIRRRFLCYLFGYLALAGFILFGVGLIMILFSPQLEHSVSMIHYDSALKIFKTLFVWGYTFALANIVSTTLLGLYYLTVRIHQ
ncbi:hypothetical protein ACEE45_09280 [Proteus vulgaris]